MKTYVKILLGVVVFIALAGIGIALVLFIMPHKDLGKARPDFVITAIDLQKAFEDNESAATAKFVNKVIEVRGIIESVKPGEGSILNVTLKTGSDLSSVICTFARCRSFKTQRRKPGDDKGRVLRIPYGCTPE